MGEQDPDELVSAPAGSFPNLLRWDLVCLIHIKASCIWARNKHVDSSMLFAGRSALCDISARRCRG